MPDWTTVSVLTVIGAWIGAITGFAGFVINWLNRRDALSERRRSEKQSEPWASLVQGYREGERVRLVVFVCHRRLDGFRITKVRLNRPHGADITTTFDNSEGPTDWPEGTRDAAVNWRVLAPTSASDDFVGGRYDMWIRLPARDGVLSLPWVRWGRSRARERSCKIELVGETAPPVRGSLRIKADVTITG